MENMDSKKKSKKGNGDGGVSSSENGLGIVDSVEGKKRKKNKEKGSRKERDGCAVSGFVAEKDGGDDEYIGEMEIGGPVGENRKKGEVLGEHGEVKKKKKKDKKSRKDRDEYLSSGHVVENEGSDTCLCETDNGSSDGKDGENGEFLEHGVGLKAETKKKKKKKKKKEKGTNVSKDGKNRSDVKDMGTPGESPEVGVIKKIEKKKMKLDKGQSKKDLGIADAICDGEDMEKEARKKKRKREKEKTMDDSAGGVVIGENLDKEVLEGVGRKKRKTGNGKNKKLVNDLVSCDGSSTIEMEKAESTKAKKDKKKVSFSGQVEVFPVPSESTKAKKGKKKERKQKRKDEQDNLVRGERFSAEEDKIVQEAVYNYIEERNLGEEGLNMVLHCSAHPEVKGCWKHIAQALPHRPHTAVYNRAHVLFQRGEKRKWSEEDCELLRKFQEEHGNQWKVMAEEFGRHRWHVKDAWRRLKLFNKKKGQWSQKEYQALFDLVNTDLRLKISEDEEKKSQHGMLRDNIHWSAISDTLTTRTAPGCCRKWYNQLASPMVLQGIWDDLDDYRLIDKLFTLDASCIEDVDWDNLLDNRSGDLCRNRWNQMVLHIGNHASKSYSEQVEILTRRYCPDLVEVREAWDNKPFVD